MNRTVCACAQCVELCKRQPGYMVHEDIGAITEHLKQQGRITADDEVKQFLWASPGAVVGRMEGRSLIKWRIGTITPRMANGRCVFLDDNDRCTIHAVSPVGCRMFDVHMDAAVGQERSAYFLKQIAGDQEYRQFRDTLERKP